MLLQNSTIQLPALLTQNPSTVGCGMSKYFDRLKEPRTFSVRFFGCLPHHQMVYPGPARRIEFQTSTLTQSLQSSVQPIHLVPKGPNFPALDSLLYALATGESLAPLQATVHMEHPVTVVGLKRIRRQLPFESRRQASGVFRLKQHFWCPILQSEKHRH
jgi:hypothetical protein